MEELKEGWRRVKLEEIDVTIEDGDRGKNYPKNTDFFSNEYCLFLNNKNIQGDKITVQDSDFITKEKDELLRKGKLKRNDIVLTTRGSIGNVGYFHSNIKNENIRINSGMVILRNNSENIDNQFLYQLLKSKDSKEKFKILSSGTAQPQLPIKDLKKLELFLPPLETQQKIASILSSLDDKIELNNEMNKTLEEMAQTLFKRWFIDFEFPNENGEPYRSSGGKMVESELGEIPEGWRVGNLNEIIEINPKETLKKGTNSVYIDMKALSETQSTISDFINRDFSGSGTKFRNKDTLMARITPCLENGKTGFINFLDNEIIAWGSTEFNILRSKNDIPKELSYLIARDENFRKHAIANMNGSSGRQRVNGKSLEEYKLPINVDFLIYQKFGIILSELMNRIENNRKEIQSLTQIRDTLLPKLMNVEVEIQCF